MSFVLPSRSFAFSFANRCHFSCFVLQTIFASAIRKSSLSVDPIFIFLVSLANLQAVHRIMCFPLPQRNLFLFFFPLPCQQALLADPSRWKRWLWRCVAMQRRSLHTKAPLSAPEAPRSSAWLATGISFSRERSSNMLKASSTRRWSAGCLRSTVSALWSLRGAVLKVCLAILNQSFRISLIQPDEILLDGKLLLS